jgi:hypothetical protein
MFRSSQSFLIIYPLSLLEEMRARVYNARYINRQSRFSLFGRWRLRFRVVRQLYESQVIWLFEKDPVDPTPD